MTTGSILRGQAEMRRMIGSIRLTKALEQKKKDAEYRSYYQDYLLYQEGKAQKTATVTNVVVCGRLKRTARARWMIAPTPTSSTPRSEP